MAPTRTLFGKKIIPNHLLNYAEQIYDILAGEIELGRWQVDDRLPGVIHLAQELGFGTKTIQTAYDRLKQDGYVRTLGYRGTYLKSMHPLARTTQGRLGVLVGEAQATQPLIQWYEHVILQQARRRGLVPEIRVVAEADLAAGDPARRGGLFGSGVDGVISLLPYPRPVRFGEARALIPLVFLCPPYETCTPRVCADVRDAYYDLTHRLARAGHTAIVFSADAGESDPRQTALHRDGYLAAMQELGRAVDPDGLARAASMQNTDAASVREGLRDLMALPPGQRPTAVVADSLGRALVLVRQAGALGLRVPGDLSVVAIGSSCLEGESGPQLTGMLPDFSLMVDQCFRLLDQQREDGRGDFTAVQVRMHLVEGHTLGRLPAGPAAVVSRV